MDEVRAYQVRSDFRRFKRLTPALALMVTTVVLLAALILSPVGPPQSTTAMTAIGAMLLTANIVITKTTGGYFDAPAAANPLLNTWSLSVEEQFYLFFPALLAAGWLTYARRRRRTPQPVIIVAAITLVSFGLAVLGSQVGVGPRTDWAIGFYGPFSRAWEFGVGAILALTLVSVGPAARRFGAGLAVAGAALLAASLWLISGSTPFPGLWTLLPVTGTLLLLLAGSAPSNPVTRALSTRPMVKVGDWSYSIYLWHWPLIVFATLMWRGNHLAVIAAAIVSFAPAVASYRFVEQPLRRISLAGTKPVVRMLLLTLGPPLLAAGALLVLSSNSWFSDTIRDFRSTTETSAVAFDTSRGCVSLPGALMPPGGSSCTWNPEAPGAPVYLAGDSNAGQFGEALISATQSAGRPLNIAISSGCPLTLLSVRFDPDWMHWNPDEQCRTYSENTLKWLEESPPGTVIISNLDTYWRDVGTQVGMNPDDLTASAPQKAQTFREGLLALVTRLEESGHKVVLVQTIPIFEGTHNWNPRACTALAVWTSTCDAAMPQQDFEANQGGLRGAVQSVAEETGATLVDLAGTLCPGEECSTANERFPYRDGEHISVRASQNLADAFASALTGATNSTGGASAISQ